MADDDIDDDFTPDDLEEDLDEDALDEDDLAPEDIEDDDALVVEVVLDVDDDAEVEPEETAEEKAVRAKKRRDEEDDDEDEVDPDDVEADLDTILKDRIAAVEEEEDEEEEEVAPRAAPETPDGVIPKRANEFTCPGCFLLVNRGQFGPPSDMRCPVGESDCPAIDILNQPAAAPTKLPAKAAGKTTKATRRK
jgi:hypothetical protein